MELDIDLPDALGGSDGENGSLDATEQDVFDLVSELNSTAGLVDHGEIEIVEIIINNQDIVTEVNATLFDAEAVATTGEAGWPDDVMHIGFASPAAAECQMSTSINSVFLEVADQIATFDTMWTTYLNTVEMMAIAVGGLGTAIDTTIDAIQQGEDLSTWFSTLTTAEQDLVNQIDEDFDYLETVTTGVYEPLQLSLIHI